jgi:hypothetical protein
MSGKHEKPANLAGWLTAWLSKKEKAVADRAGALTAELERMA